MTDNEKWLAKIEQEEKEDKELQEQLEDGELEDIMFDANFGWED